MTETKPFHLGDILSVTTGRLVSPRHIGGVYDILNWMTGDNLFTHQLPRACDECQGPLLAQYPDLAVIEPPETFGDGSKDGAKDAVGRWLAEQVAIYGETREVTPLAAEDHTRRSLAYGRPTATRRRSSPPSSADSATRRSLRRG
jgi:hypothetical protein